MANLSLRVRSLILAFSALLVFVPALILTLERAYVSSLEQAKYDELKLMSLAMITAFELDDNDAYMPQQLFEEQLNLPGSGYIGFVIWQGEVVWRSLSALDYQDPEALPIPAVGDEKFEQFPLPSSQQSSTDESPFVYIYSVEYENNGAFEPVTFAIFNEQTEFQAERQAFMTTLWQWLLLLSLALLALIFIIAQRLLAPVTDIIENIKAAEKGHIDKLTDSYPPELERLKSSINQLLESEAQQRLRYKNSLGDLAHSLKTPLAVLMNSESMPTSAKEPLQQLNKIIKRQLTRSVGSEHARYKFIDLATVAHKLIAAMQKIHADKALQINATVAPDARIQCDETDITELLGNLLDNACKAAKGAVQLIIKVQSNSVIMHVDDDGNGIKQQDADKILTRGQRLDTYDEGQGIGLSVVLDIIESYNGQLKITTSPLGGARFSVRLLAH